MHLMNHTAASNHRVRSSSIRYQSAHDRMQSVSHVLLVLCLPRQITPYIHVHPLSHEPSRLHRRLIA